MKITVTASQPPLTTPKPGHLYRHESGGIYLAAVVGSRIPPVLVSIFAGPKGYGNSVGTVYDSRGGFGEYARLFTDLGPAQVTIE